MRIVTTLAATLGALISPIARADPVEGRWLTDDGKGVVTIARCGASLCGRISKVLDAGPGVPRTDVNNPDPRERGRPIVGLPVLSGFTFSGGKWRGGTAYDPKTGSSYRASVTPNRDGSLTMTGCILFLCRSRRWTRMTN